MPRRAPLPQPARPDAALAGIFLGNAVSKLDAAEWAARSGMDNAALHGTAIAIELLLKSYLLSIATDDGWNRANIGHDLAKALHYSTQVGLTPPSRLEWVIGHVHPHFQDGGFHRHPSKRWPPGLARESCGILRQLVESIQHHVLPI